MGRGADVTVAGFGLMLAMAQPTLAQTSRPDPLSRLALLGAAFKQDDAQPAAQGVTAMAFLPGRGVVRWNIAGKTPEEAREAQVEAMGLADARAVQREIDAAPAPPVAPRARPTTTASMAQSTPIGRVRAAEGAAVPNRTARDQVAAVLGLRDGATMKDRPRVYAFAAVSGRGIGLNVTHDETGWQNAGLTTDRGGFTGQRQAGLAWRTGPAQTSLSYVTDKTRTQILGMQSIKDQRVMLTMALTPQALVGLFRAEP